MSAVLQARVGESEVAPAADREIPVPRPVAGPDDPLHLLRTAINRLNSSNGELQDQAQMANLLSEVQEALHRANRIGLAVAEAVESVAHAQFDDALQALDACLLIYPDNPTLLERRAEVEERRTAFACATTVRAVLEEAEWLVQQDRLDLAVHLLKEKTAALPDQPELVSRLDEIELLLPQWEQDRQVHAALERVAALAERQQWQVALAIVEDTLQSYAASEELTEAVRSVRDRLEQNERQTRLERRLQLIGQKIASRSWKQALALLETTGKEFPDASGMKPLQLEVQAGLRRDECEAIALEVGQCLTDGELESAEQILQRGLESLGPEPALDEVRRQLESEKKYREGLHTAQALVGRHQLQEAERILTELVAQNRTEAQALLDAVRQERAVTEEEDFCEKGRLKALKLMQQEQFAQAADLLANLLTLFPGNPILERDLIIARSATGLAASAVAAPIEEPKHEEPPVAHALVRAASPLMATPFSPAPDRPPRTRWAVIAGAASLVVAAAGAIAWNPSHVAAPSSGSSAHPKMTQATTPPAPPQSTAPSPDAPQVPEKPASPAPKASKTVPAKPAPQPAPPPARTVRAFAPPPAIQKPGHATLAAPLETETVVSAQLPGSSPNVTASLPAAQPPVQPRPTPQSPAPAASAYREPQLIDRTLPAYPTAARLRGISGVVRLQATIDEHGNVKNMKILSGDMALSPSATQAVSMWKYKPATLNGKPVASTTTIQVNFGDSNTSRDSQSSGDAKK